MAVMGFREKAAKTQNSIFRRLDPIDYTIEMLEQHRWEKARGSMA